MKESEYALADDLQVAVIISGRGSNLQALLESHERWPFRIKLVVSNRPHAPGLTLAERAGCATMTIDERDYEEFSDFEATLGSSLLDARVDLVVLAGFLRVLSADFVTAWHGRMINIHPSLLPKYRGLHTHRRVLSAGDREHGASVHFVTPALDAGPTIAQIVMPVREGDDEEALATKLLPNEHLLLKQVVGWIACGRIELVKATVLLDGLPLATPVRFAASNDSALLSTMS